MGQRFYGEFNQAGMGTPATGEQSRLITRNLGKLAVDSAPLFFQGSDLNYVDTRTGFPAVQDVPLYKLADYNGELPATVQPTGQRPTPWGP